MSIELSPKATEIADYTQSLLVSGGYNSFSYATIAAQVKISKASIHHHFPSKAELVQVVVARYRETARQGLSMIEQAHPQPLDALNAYMNYWSGCILEGVSSFCICAMLASEIPSIPSEVADEVRGHFEDLSTWLSNILALGSEQGVFVLNNTPETEARALMAYVHGSMLAARGLGDPQVFPTLTALAVDRLTAQSS
ncbi:TetR/AcrR family transcriptional regulator [Saccharospirillum mangrovi]|uniref:TetR/AcrR family transcriptional regulator n=1 Tax=Saccharospirillum mangrovi TaxID=2161747 RepID=UPI000D3C8248|nr:TetR/AcrR family transcriptional regulator [Saccharospirillum mangrovi]